MSSTRKIPGYALDHGEWVEFDAVASAGEAWKRATLVIHYGEHQTMFTDEEHEAEFQRRAAELLKEVIDENMGAAATYAVRAVAERRNIQLP